MTKSIHNQNKQRIGDLPQSALRYRSRRRLPGQLKREIFAPGLPRAAGAIRSRPSPASTACTKPPTLPCSPPCPTSNAAISSSWRASPTASSWVGCCGHYMGVFERPWLDIPPTRHLTAMRYHEFFRLEDGTVVVEMQALWDIPQVMMQARAWPLAPSLAVGMGRARPGNRRRHHQRPLQRSAKSQSQCRPGDGDARSAAALARRPGSHAARSPLASRK